jgi:hypothetical protein
MTRRTICESVPSPGPLVSWASEMCRRPWPCNCQAGGSEPDEPKPDVRSVPADHREPIRESWAYARRIDALTDRWIAPGPDWMR